MKTLNFNLKTDANGKLISYKDEEALAQYLEYILLTEKGEIPFKPDLGCGLRQRITSVTSRLSLLTEIDIIYDQFVKHLKPALEFESTDIGIKISGKKLIFTFEYNKSLNTTKNTITIEL